MRRHGNRLGGGARSIAVDGQNPDRVFGELVESVHLVVNPAHLHALDGDAEQRLTRLGAKRLRITTRRSPAPFRTGSRSTAAGSPGRVR